MSSTYEYVIKDRLLTVENLAVHYGDKKVLDGVSFHIDDIVRPNMEQGQVVSILGPSGIGKTKLFRCIAGLQAPTSGKVTLNGTDIPVQPGEVGVVMQSYPLLQHRTILGNLELVAKGAEGKKSAMELLERFKLTETQHMYPSQLSGGQRQRIAIIQQLLCSTHFILMDEPFSGLDPMARLEVCALIDEISHLDELNTTIVITHDIEYSLLISDTILMIGRDRDDKGNPIPGAKIQKKIDLIERDLAWHKDIESRPNYLPTLREIKETFKTL